ncbi:TSUP family transporter [Roseomonas sp. BN140053]|uniref:TSUP family transporter n=1 Tax=Roseomonas sp. BN140053 TaxID=3391898 RepID=UPI0039EB2212
MPDANFAAGLSPALVALGLFMVFGAGLIRGFTGFGFALAAVPLLSLILPPAQAVPLVLVLQALVGLSGVRRALYLCDWRSLRLLLLGALLATPPGLWALTVLPAGLLRLLIAAAVLAAVGVLAGGLRLPGRARPWHALPFGVLAGLFNGTTGMPGPPVIAFFLASPNSTAVARASMVVFFLATSGMALLPLALGGVVTGPVVGAAALTFPAVWAGSWLGDRLYRASPGGHYRPVALGLMVATAALAALRALLGEGG